MHACKSVWHRTVQLRDRRSVLEKETTEMQRRCVAKLHTCKTCSTSKPRITTDRSNPTTQAHTHNKRAFHLSHTHTRTHRPGHRHTLSVALGVWSQSPYASLPLLSQALCASLLLAPEEDDSDVEGGGSHGRVLEGVLAARGAGEVVAGGEHVGARVPQQQKVGGVPQPHSVHVRNHDAHSQRQHRLNQPHLGAPHSVEGRGAPPGTATPKGRARKSGQTKQAATRTDGWLVVLSS